jgi:hypothetical protein
MARIDEWLNAWRTGLVQSKQGAFRSLGPLHAYAMFAGGTGLEFSGPLPAWPDLAERLRNQRVELGLIAVEVPADHAYFKYPGVTLAFDGPHGGTQIAREVMLKLAKLGVGGVLAGTENNGRFGVLRIIMAPRWYANTGDKLFGLDWSKVPNDPVHSEEAKKAWALGMHTALRTALADIPEVFIDTIKLGAFDVVDWLHDLGPREATFLYGAKPRQLATALYNLGSYELDELSGEKHRPFIEGGPLLTLYDELEDEVTMEWLRDQLASPDCILLHARGRVDSYSTDFILILLRRRADGRVRLTTVNMSPADVIMCEDCFEVDPMVFAWPKIKGIPSQGAGDILSAFVERYGDLHEAGTYHLRSGVVEDDAYREGLMAWFQKSPSSAGDYERLSDLNRRVYALMRETFQDDIEERQLSSKESEELFEWLAEVGQQNVELDWLLHHWEREWRPSGLEPDEIEKFVRRL